MRPVVAVTPLRASGSGGAHVTVVRRDGQPGPSVVLGTGEVLCGRTEGELLIRDDASVSPRHARFSLEPEGGQVTDLGSVNGTFLRLREPCTLVPGDEIRVGRQFLRLELVPRPTATPGSSDDGSTPWGSPDRGARLRLAQLMDGGGLGEVFPLDPGENYVGREVGSILFPQDRYVSGRHCNIDVSETGVTVTDQGSSNGTFVRIKGSAPLQAGDQILIGMQLLRFDA